ncbi:MAG: phosphate butyryltransferase [Bulleidia sp.]
MSNGFHELRQKAAEGCKKVISVTCAQDEAVLEAVYEAHQMGIVDGILVGDEAKIIEIAAKLNMDLSDFTVVNETDNVQATLKAVSLVHEGKADMYMKGLVPTKDFLKSVLNKEVGLRTGKTLSHVAVMQVPGIDRLLFLSDVAFLPYPTLEDKKQIISYAVDVAKACGVETPKVAPLAAVEVVNPKMPATVDADELRKANEAGEITGCVVDGPLSLDIALEEAAAIEKGAQDRPCAGKADILLFPDIHAGNITYKTMAHLVPGIQIGCMLVGTSAPVILASRSDSKDVKINSIALGAVLAEHMKKVNG